MILYLIKVLGIFLVIICCLIATYTDVKNQIIPNKLTFSIFVIGIFLTTLYYYIINDFRLSYYISILIVYLFSYFLWCLGVWAGGDVKLFTALSTLLIPEFLDIIPNFILFGNNFPLGVCNFIIPSLLLIFNSVLSIIPIILIYTICIIIKKKHNLMHKFKDSLNIKMLFISLNSLVLSYSLISIINIHQVLIKIVFLIFLSYVISKIISNDYMLILVSLIIILHQSFTENIIIYFEELILLTLILSIKNIYQQGLIKEALTDEIDVLKLTEGMILQYPVYYDNNHYYFDKKPWYNFTKQNGELICSNKSCGLSNSDIELLNIIFQDSTVYIKKGFPFAPFILSGLFITLTIGNTFELLKLIWGLI